MKHNEETLTDDRILLMVIPYILFTGCKWDTRS